MPKESSDGPLLLITESALDSVWERLSAFESHRVSLRLIHGRLSSCSVQYDSVDPESKATALAYCIKNAREYLQLPNTSLTTAATANYYGCLWLAAAEAVSRPESVITLSMIEDVTKKGHGLGNHSAESNVEVFPRTEFIFIRPDGFFANFLKWCGASKEEVESISWKKKPSDADIGDPRLIPLLGLLSRIPELIETFETVTEIDARCFHIFHAANGLQGASATHPIGIRGDYSKAHLLDCSLPIENLVELRPLIGLTEYRNCRWAGIVPNLASKTNFWDWVRNNPIDQRFYISPLSGNSYCISPLLGFITSPIALHLMLSYQLSILARYRPAVWREIVEGSLDEYRVLISTYNKIVTRVMPHLVLNAITDRRIRLATPGSAD